MKTVQSLSLRALLLAAAVTIFAFGVISRAFAATPPSISIVSPSPDQTVAGNKVTVIVSVPNLNLVDYRLYPKDSPSQGHLHLWLDQADLPKTSAIKTSSPSYTFENVKTGPHTLVAELVKNDHSSYSPPVRSRIIFTTTEAATASATRYKPPSPIFLGLITVILLSCTLYLVNLQRQSASHQHKSKKTPARKKW